MPHGEFGFCPHCGARLAAVPHWQGLGFRRHCDACERTIYRNPAVGVAVVLLRNRTILLGRRARGPYAGLWCIPCGYVEWDEEIRSAARREMQEETGLAVEIGPVCAVHSNFHDRSRQTVGVWFHGRVIGGRMRADDDLDELRYFPVDAPPPLAFPTDAEVISALRDKPGSA
jgi:8-oxo-dGTP diphosphatase